MSKSPQAHWVGAGQRFFRRRGRGRGRGGAAGAAGGQQEAAQEGGQGQGQGQPDADGHHRGVSPAHGRGDRSKVSKISN